MGPTNTSQRGQYADIAFVTS